MIIIEYRYTIHLSPTTNLTFNALHSFSAIHNLVSIPFSISIIDFLETPAIMDNRYIDKPCFERSIFIKSPNLIFITPL